jgi:hypothetical protein
MSKDTKIDKINNLTFWTNYTFHADELAGKVRNNLGDTKGMADRLHGERWKVSLEGRKIVKNLDKNIR